MSSVTELLALGRRAEALVMLRTAVEFDAGGVSKGQPEPDGDHVGKKPPAKAEEGVTCVDVLDLHEQPRAEAIEVEALADALGDGGRARPATGAAKRVKTEQEAVAAAATPEGQRLGEDGGEGDEGEEGEGGEEGEEGEEVDDWQREDPPLYEPLRTEEGARWEAGRPAGGLASLAGEWQAFAAYREARPRIVRLAAADAAPPSACVPLPLAVRAGQPVLRGGGCGGRARVAALLARAGHTRRRRRHPRRPPEPVVRMVDAPSPALRRTR